MTINAATRKRNPSDSVLVNMLLHRPADGVDLLLTHRVPIVIATLRKRGRVLSAQMADELAIDLSSTVWESIHTFDSEKGSLNSWMITIAWRITDRYEELSLPCETERIERSTTGVSSPRSVRTVMISEQVRRVMREVMTPGMRSTLEIDLASPSGRGDTKEIQSETGGSQNAVYQRRKRAHKVLKIRMRQYATQQMTLTRPSTHGGGR